MKKEKEPFPPKPWKAVISEQGQITIPHQIRERLGLVAGIQVVFQISSDGQVVMMKYFQGDPISSWKGKASPSMMGRNTDEYLSSIRDDEGE